MFNRENPVDVLFRNFSNSHFASLPIIFAILINKVNSLIKTHGYRQSRNNNNTAYICFTIERIRANSR